MKIQVSSEEWQRLQDEVQMAEEQHDITAKSGDMAENRYWHGRREMGRFFLRFMGERII